MSPKAMITELPHAQGFSATSPSNLVDLTLNKAEKNSIIEVLRQRKFTKGTKAHGTRLYNNLVVLFRMLLFYVDLKHTSVFWENVKEDWGLDISDKTPWKVLRVVEYYTATRIRCSILKENNHSSLLTRLVDLWIELRDRITSRSIDLHATWAVRRAAWANIRNTQSAALLNDFQPLWNEVQHSAISLVSNTIRDVNLPPDRWKSGFSPDMIRGQDNNTAPVKIEAGTETQMVGQGVVFRSEASTSVITEQGMRASSHGATTPWPRTRANSFTGQVRPVKMEPLDLQPASFVPAKKRPTADDHEKHRAKRKRNWSPSSSTAEEQSSQTRSTPGAGPTQVIRGVGKSASTLTNTLMDQLDNMRTMIESSPVKIESSIQTKMRGAVPEATLQVETYAQVPSGRPAPMDGNSPEARIWQLEKQVQALEARLSTHLGSLSAPFSTTLTRRP